MMLQRAIRSHVPINCSHAISVRRMSHAATGGGAFVPNESQEAPCCHENCPSSDENNAGVPLTVASYHPMSWTSPSHRKCVKSLLQAWTWAPFHSHSPAHPGGIAGRCIKPTAPPLAGVNKGPDARLFLPGSFRWSLLLAAYEFIPSGLLFRQPKMP